MTEITREQYEVASKQQDECQGVINAYHTQQLERFEKRLSDGTPFTDEELVYAASLLCPCGHGLAYPKDCGPFHYWDCSAILKGIADPKAKHSGQLPFAFYDVKAESEHAGTTRGVFKPKPSETVS